MSASEQITAQLPRLRRFARAVTGSQKSGDAYVVSTLEAILAEPRIFPQGLPARIALYRTFLKIMNSVELNGHADPDTPPGLGAANRNLSILAPKARQAFLLVAVEEFSPQDAAAALDVGAAELESLIDEAGRDIAKQIETDVLIVEDEPLIAIDLQRILEDLGHRVTSIARTHVDAMAAAELRKPGLVLADIRLADGSSGLDAVNDILGSFSVPAIFVTAYPERLLTGTRPEPTFLITKPFRPENVKAVISQALFFDVRGRAERPRLATA
jgi:DNA-directed RNA polymerase specialized sigma24 family protein/CheY-like chemotaxis protein